MPDGELFIPDSEEHKLIRKVSLKVINLVYNSCKKGINRDMFIVRAVFDTVIMSYLLQLKRQGYDAYAKLDWYENQLIKEEKENE